MKISHFRKNFFSLHFIITVFPCACLLALCFDSGKEPAVQPSGSIDTARVVGQYTAELTHAPFAPRSISNYTQRKK